MKTKILFLSSILLFCSISLIAQANSIFQPRTANNVCAILYENINYEGASYTILGTDVGIPWIGSDFNDITSSVFIPSRCYVTLYDDWNFAGRSLTLYSSISWIGSNFNDTISSLKCYCF